MSSRCCNFAKYISITAFVLILTILKDFTNSSLPHKYVNNKNDSFSEIFVFSSTYYNISSIYPSDSVVVLFNAHRNTSIKQTWYCISSNLSHHKLVTEIYPNKPFFQQPHCNMRTFASNCFTVQNPNYFAISPSISSSNDENSKGVPLLLRNAIVEKLPVVSCVSPLFFNERWQINAFSIEIYAYFGVSRQAYYYMSILENGFLLLKEYEKLKLIDLHPWTIPDIDGLRKEVEFRNQATAHNDCYLLYREAADFIIVHDPDDILLLDNMTNYWTSLARMFLANPYTGDLSIIRRNSYIQLAKTFDKSSIIQSLESIEITAKNLSLKSIMFTKGVETITAHQAEFRKDKYIQTYYQDDKSLFLHIRNISYSDEFTHKKDDKFPNLLSFDQISDIINVKHFSRIKKAFDKRSAHFANLNFHSNLTFTNYYYDQVDTCYESIYYKYRYIKASRPCPSHFLCTFSHLPGVRCVQAIQKYYKTFLNNLTIYSYKKYATNLVSENGCSFDK